MIAEAIGLFLFCMEMEGITRLFIYRRFGKSVVYEVSCGMASKLGVLYKYNK